MKKIIVFFGLLFSLFCSNVNAFEVYAICEDKDGNSDIYVFSYTNETNEQINKEIYDYCSSIGRLYIGDIEK